MGEAATAPTSSSDGFKVLWAKSKPRHPLWKHLLDASAVSLALPPPIDGFDWTTEKRAFLVGLHDLGKANAGFQHQEWTDEDGQRRSFSADLDEAGFRKTGDAPCRHEQLSATFIEDCLVRAGVDGHVADAISGTMRAHHGYWDKTPGAVGEPYAKAQNQLLEMLRNVLRIDAFLMVTPSNLSAFGMRLCGHVVLCDWIASNERFFTDVRLRGVEDTSEYFERVREVAEQWTDDLGLKRTDGSGSAACVVDRARPIQQALLDNDIPPGLVIIEAPMGEGKTEAAWILAEKWRDEGYTGMYMALPTMATSDSLHGRYGVDYLKKMGRGEDAKLVHGMAWLRDNNEPDKAPEVGEPGDDRSLAAAWFRPTRRAMLAAHGVGTVDQAMLAGMNVKFGFLRLYGLADRVLVIDEVHAYDAYMSAIIARLLNWCACLKIPVIMLSATLSAGQRRAMLEAYGATGGDPGPSAQYPLITVAEPEREVWTIDGLKASSSRVLMIKTHPGMLGDAIRTANIAEELVKDGGCCCVILNTVKQAQAVYKALKLPEKQRLLFHARFTALDRERITSRVLDMTGKDTSNRPAKFVLVATQVVEQSLDVDFDQMITEIAPIDLLLQRSGRLHRHRKRDHDPSLHVLLPQDGEPVFGGTGYVYAEKPLLRTLAILAVQPQAHLPEDFRKLIERCYGSEEWAQEAVEWEVIRRADQNWSKETELLHNQGGQLALCSPNPRFFRPVGNDPTGDDSDDGNGWRAKTRLGANDYTAVLVEEAELQRLELGELPMREVRHLYQRSVKLPSYLPLDRPAQGYGAKVDAKGKLRGLVLLPVDKNGLWRGCDEKGNSYEVTYHNKLGLMAGRVQ